MSRRGGTLRRPVMTPGGPDVRRRAAPGSLGGASARRWALAFMAVGCLACAASFFVGLAGATTLLTAVGFGAALFGLYRPTVGLYGIGMLCTVDAMTRVFLASDGGLFRWNTFNYLLLGVAVLHAPFLLGFRNAQLRLLQALTCLTAAGLLLSQDVTRGSYDLLALCSVFGLLIYFLKASASDEAWRGLALVTGSLGALMGLAFFRSAATGILMDPNAWVAVPVCGLFGICLGFSKVRGGRTQAVLALLAVINTSWAFLSGSRGGLLTSLTALLFLLLMVKGLHRRAVALGAAAIIALAISSAFGALQDQALHRINKLLDPNETMEHRTSRRSDLLLGGLYIFAQHPLMGVGTGNFVPAWEALSGTREMGDYRAATGKIAHSGWIKVLAENGLPGGLLFGAFVASFAILGWRSRQREPRILGFFATVTLATVFATQEFQSKAQWFLAAGVMALLQHHRMSGPLDSGSQRREGSARRLSVR